MYGKLQIPIDIITYDILYKMFKFPLIYYDMLKKLKSLKNKTSELVSDTAPGRGELLQLQLAKARRPELSPPGFCGESLAAATPGGVLGFRPLQLGGHGRNGRNHDLWCLKNGAIHFLGIPASFFFSDKWLNASSRTIWLCHQNLKQHGICKGQKMVKKQNQKMFVIHTGWGPQDSVQLPYKWLNFMVYGRCNMIYNYSFHWVISWWNQHSHQIIVNGVISWLNQHKPITLIFPHVIIPIGSMVLEYLPTLTPCM